MSTVRKAKHTVDEYLAQEAVALQKHEYYQGDISAMSSGSPAHNRVSGNIYWRLAQQLEGKACLPFNSESLVNADSLFTYPDVSVVCPPIEREPGPIEVLLNPRVIIEVLSPSTERYDRNVKFPHYRQIASVQEILLVQPDAAGVEHYARGVDDSWILTTTSDLTGVVDLPSIGCKLPMEQIYANVAFPSAPFGVV